MFKTIRRGAAAGAFSLISLAAAAAANPLSVHVLDLQNGQPMSGVAVDLEHKSGADWQRLASAVTDSQGRIPALYPESRPFAVGQYRVVFHTGEHYAQSRQATFFPEIVVPFRVDDAAQHYHVPLLLSPYGYSTYRGN